ncbi:MAG: IMP cyclohydrolase [Methanothrix sp.]|nr:IMP cyclohydrolase [Methanothrix sp.]
MYVGRIVIVGMSHGRCFVAYRVSSRSFPNRRAEARDGSILVSPKDPSDLARNPYIAYTCIRTLDEVAVVANGTQTDTIMESIEDGMGPLKAIGLSLLAFGHERDELNTPRLAGAVKGDRAWLGIAMRDEIRAKELSLREGTACMVATYERTGFGPVDLGGSSPEEIALRAYGLPFERPVCSAAALFRGKGFDLAAYNPD